MIKKNIWKCTCIAIRCLCKKWLFLTIRHLKMVKSLKKISKLQFMDETSLVWNWWLQFLWCIDLSKEQMRLLMEFKAALSVKNWFDGNCCSIFISFNDSRNEWTQRSTNFYPQRLQLYIFVFVVLITTSLQANNCTFCISLHLKNADFRVTFSFVVLLIIGC